MGTGSAGCHLYLISDSGLGFNHPDSRLRGNDGGTQGPATEAKRESRTINLFPLHGAYRGRFTETKPKPKPTDPFPLYGGRLGWGCRAQARLCRVQRFRRKPTPASAPLWKARMGARKRRLCGRDARAPRAAKPTPESPSWGKARMGVSRASSPRPAANKSNPYKPFMGEG